MMKVLSIGIGLLFGSQVMAMGNPAAIFCVDIARGDYQVISDKAGNQSGLCVVGDAAVEGWSLYRSSRLDKQGNPKSEKPTVTLALKALAAHKTCDQVKGAKLRKMDQSGETVQLCVFTDNSIISAETLKLPVSNQSRQEVLNLL